jgi:hypothetical protein
MAGARALRLGIVAVLLLGSVELAYANAPPPLPDGKPPIPIPNPVPDPPPSDIIPSVEPPPPPPPPKRVEPRRTGVFRSCGSGMGPGLAGIGVGWAMLWLGTRFANRVSRSAQKSPSRRDDASLHG